MKSVKPLLLICGAFMAIAAVVGTVDYSQASNSGKLKNLYKDDAKLLTEPPSPSQSPSLPPPPDLLSFYSRAALPQYLDSVSKKDAALNAAYKKKNALYILKHVKRKSAGKVY